jgi:putative endonuclease
MIAGHLRRGRRAEAIACRWLIARGLKHVASNFRSRFGELDLIMRDGSCLVIVEVRYRNTSNYGGAIASITGKKRLRIARATEYFLRQQPRLRHMELRFDVLALSGAMRAPTIDWRKHAFSFDDEIAGFDP